MRLKIKLFLVVILKSHLSLGVVWFLANANCRPRPPPSSFL